MKRLIFISILFISCNDAKKESSSSIPNISQDSIEWQQALVQSEVRQKAWNQYEKVQLELVGLINPDSVKLEKGEILYQFKTIGEKSKYFEVIQILNNSTSIKINCKKVKYQIDLDCHPDLGNKVLDINCINIINSKDYEIDSAVIDSLSKYLVTVEFWEQTESLSEFRTHGTVRFYHGIVWDYTATYGLRYPTKSEVDTFITNQHRVTRAPMDSRILNKVSKAIQNVLNNKMPDYNT